jgi:hypothetical protein
LRWARTRRSLSTGVRSISLPRFIDRVLDATAPALGALDRTALVARLDATCVTLTAGERVVEGPRRAGFLLAANLAARLYPSISLSGPDSLAREAKAEIMLINPHASVGVSDERAPFSLAFDSPGENGAAVNVCARGWNVYVDDIPDNDHSPTAPAAMLAAVLGISELFRVVFAEELGLRGRRGRQPGAFNIVTLGEPTFDLPAPNSVDLGPLTLVGAGAIGQATALTLAEAGATGIARIVDHEEVALSNLQRYVLTYDGDVGTSKVDLLRDRLGKFALKVVPIQTRFHTDLVEDQVPTLVALDSPQDRIGVQASLPGPIYNAWTQPADVGWSRHEAFGEAPCLACLYWPSQKRRSRHEEVAAAFRQHPLRALAYLVHRGIPVGLPLPPGSIPILPGVLVPPQAGRWMQVPLIEDIALAAGVSPGQLAGWGNRSLADVYQEGICGGALVGFNVGERAREVLVPLAQQSALAGVMLATQLVIATVPELAAARPVAIEGRFDVLAGLPQVLPRPRARTRECLCADADFLEVYSAKINGVAS